MAKTSINYLFPPDQINNLPTWRFALHFKAPSLFRDRKTAEAAARLKSAEWKIIEFPFGIDDLPYDSKGGTVAVRIENWPDYSDQYTAKVKRAWKGDGQSLGSFISF